MLVPQVIQNQLHKQDHFALMLIIATVVHVLIILGVNFGGFEIPEENKIIPSMEVTLVNTRSDFIPENVDFLAQANQEGGGNTSEKVRPETPFVPLIPKEIIQMTDPNPPVTASAKKENKTRTELLTQQESRKKVVTEIEPVIKKDSKLITAADLMQQSHAIASLEANLGESMQAYSKMPDHKWISAATKEYKYASYMESWRHKVEKIGNLNFPKEAKRKNLAGNLILDVAINADGTIYAIAVARSSGHKVLDDAAVRIVHLAAPFAPLPPEILKETDILHITRTWKFLGDDRISTK